MDADLALLPKDERDLLIIVRDVKRSGFGDFNGSVVHGKVKIVKEAYTHDLTK